MKKLLFIILFLFSCNVYAFVEVVEVPFVARVSNAATSSAIAAISASHKNDCKKQKDTKEKSNC